MLEGARETIGGGVKTLKTIGRALFVVGDIAVAGLYMKGELHRYLIEGTIKTAETIKDAAYVLSNGNGAAANNIPYNNLANIIVKNLPDIATLTWLTFSVFWTGHVIYSGIKGKKP